MTLKAVVYTSKTNLPAEVFEHSLEFDDATGETYSDEPGFNARFPKTNFVAAEAELGNVTLVSRLYQMISTVVDREDQSVILQKVLYSGTHCGDTLHSENIKQMQAEINAIKQSAVGAEPDVASLLRHLSNLARSAEEQRQPIVFV